MQGPLSLTCTVLLQPGGQALPVAPGGREGARPRRPKGGQPRGGVRGGAGRVAGTAAAGCHLAAAQEHPRRQVPWSFTPMFVSPWRHWCGTRHSLASAGRVISLAGVSWPLLPCGSERDPRRLGSVVRSAGKDSTIRQPIAGSCIRRGMAWQTQCPETAPCSMLLCACCALCSYGVVDSRPKYHTPTQLWPVGFKATSADPQVPARLPTLRVCLNCPSSLAPEAAGHACQVIAPIT